MNLRDLKKQERTAIEAVARRFSARWEIGSDPRDAYIIVAGKRFAVDVTTLKRRGVDQGSTAKPRLRFDKVATRLIERLQATLGDTVPDGMTVLLTITAPIRMPSKTAASLAGLTANPTLRDACDNTWEICGRSESIIDEEVSRRSRASSRLAERRGRRCSRSKST